MRPARRKSWVGALALLVTLALPASASAGAQPAGSVRLSDGRTFAHWAHPEHRASVRRLPSHDLTAGRSDPLPHRGRVPRGLPRPAALHRSRRAHLAADPHPDAPERAHGMGPGLRAGPPVPRPDPPGRGSRAAARHPLPLRPADMAVPDRRRNGGHPHPGGPLLDPREVQGGERGRVYRAAGVRDQRLLACSATGPGAA